MVAELGRCLVPVRPARACDRDGPGGNRANRHGNTHKRASWASDRKSHGTLCGRRPHRQPYLGCPSQAPCRCECHQLKLMTLGGPGGTRGARRGAGPTPRRRRGRPGRGERPPADRARLVRGLRFPLPESPEDLTEGQGSALAGSRGRGRRCGAAACPRRGCARCSAPTPPTRRATRPGSRPGRATGPTTLTTS